MSIEITEAGKKVTFGFRCQVCDQKWRADATDCNSVSIDDEYNPYGEMECVNCGAYCYSTNFLKENK